MDELISSDLLPWIIKLISASILAWYMKRDKNIVTREEFKLWREEKEKNDVLIREQASKDRKHIDSKLEKLSQSFHDYTVDIKTHFNVDEKKRKTILIYDDDPISIDILKEKLLMCKENLTFKIARTFEEALYLLKFGRADFIFSDLVHNNQDLGLIFYDQYKTHNKFNNIPFYLYSAKEKPEKYDGIFINKDIRIENLKELI